MPEGDVINNWKQRWGYAAALVDSLSPRRTAPETQPLRNLGLAKDDTSGQFVSHPDPISQLEPLLERGLAQSVLGRLRDRWAVDRTAANDQITGIAYTRQRQSDLAKIAGENHYLVREYGMRTITDLTPTDRRSGIRIDHDRSSPYMRDELDLDTRKDKPVESTFEALYNKNKKSEYPDYDRDKMVFVNAPSTIDKLTAIYGKDWTPPDGKTDNNVLTGNKVETLEVAPGFYALSFGSKLSEGQRKALTGNMLPGVGATPSTHQASKELTNTKNSRDPLTDENLLKDKVDNLATLDNLGNAKGLKTLGSLPKDHPMKTIAGATVSMITGLNQALGKLRGGEKESALKQNALIDSSLNNIGQLIEAMQTYMDDIPRFSRLFDVLVDEVYLALAVARPYTSDDYKKAAKDSVVRRAPTLKSEDMKGVETSTYLLSSGMDTLASGVIAAKAALGVDKIDLMSKESKARTRGANYFEVQFNMLGDQTLEKDGPLIMGTLNPSTPTRKMDSTNPDWSVDSLIEGINNRITKKDAEATPEKPMVAVIDITVEKDNEKSPELDKIISTFKTQIASGALQIVLCKSYQKFPSLGSGKAMAGGVTVIGKQDSATCKALNERLGKSENDEKVMNNDEAQLVAHFTQHEEAMEQPMLGRAANNANFIRGLLPKTFDTKGLKYLYADGLPFVAIPDAKIKLSGGSGASETRPDDLLHTLGVENRFSFGFQNTSCLPFPEGVRIAAGQESEGEIMEKLFTVMNIVNPGTPKPITPETITTLAQQTAGEACAELEGVLSAPLDDDKAASRRQTLIARLRNNGMMTEAQAKDLMSKKKPDTDAVDKALIQLLKSLRDKNTAPPKGYGVPGDELAESYKEVADTLASGRKPETAENAEWRKDVANRLLRAGAINPTDVVFTDGAVTSLLGKSEPGKIDDTLSDLIAALHSQSEVTVGTRTYAPGELADIQEEMTLGPAYTKTASKLCGECVEDAKKNRDWRESVVKRLIDAGALAKSEVERNSKQEITSVLSEKKPGDIDKLLKKLLDDLGKGSEIEIGTRKIMPEQIADIQRKMTGVRKKAVPDGKEFETQLALVTSYTGTEIRENAPNAAKLAKTLGEGRKEDSSQNEKWRADVADRLVKAGALAKADIKIEDEKLVQLLDVKNLGEIDKKLTELLKILQSTSEVTVGTRTYKRDEVAEIHRKMTGAEEDVNRMHANTRQGWQTDAGTDLKTQGKSAAYLPNIVTCCALTNEALFKDPGSAKAFTDLADPVIKRGLDQLSPEAQQRLLRKRAEVAIRGGCLDPGNEAAINDAANTLRMMVKKQPYREGGANLLKGADLAATVSAWPKPEKDNAEKQKAALGKIVEACTSRLDPQSELDLVNSLVESVKSLGKLQQDTTGRMKELERTLPTASEDMDKLVKGKEQLQASIEATSLTATVDKNPVTKTIAEFRAVLKTMNEEVGRLFQAKNSTDGSAKKKEADSLKSLIEGEVNSKRGEVEEFDRKIGAANDSIKKLQGELDALQEAIKPLEPHRRIADVLCGQLEKKVASVTAQDMPLSATKLGTIPLGEQRADPKRMTEKQLDDLKSGVKLAREEVDKLKA